MTLYPGFRIRALLPLFCLGLAITQSAAARDEITADGYEWRKGDWSLTCDNTRTCRLVYGNEERLDTDPHPSVTLLFTQPAGPAPLAPMESKAVGPEGEIENFDIDGMWLDQPGHPAPSDPAELLAQAAEAKTLFVRIRQLDGSSDIAQVRLQGLKAVLLKLDDVQHRAGTRLALVAKGAAAADKILPALAPPVITAVPFKMTQLNDAQFPPETVEGLLRQASDWLRGAKPDDDCSKMEPPTLAVSGDLWVLGQACSSGSGYNQTRYWWLGHPTGPANAPSARAQASLQGVVWEAIPANGEYDERGFTQTDKGRGIGDCMGIESWVYTQDHRWAKTTSLFSGPCMGIVGGPWELPTWVTTVEWPPG